MATDSDAMAMDATEIGSEVLAPMTPLVAECGVLYVATGEKYLAEAEQSARSVKKASPKVPIAIISDGAPCHDLFDVKLPLPNPRYHFSDKILPLTRTPFERTLFLDSDTFVIEPLDEIFQLLDRFDIAAAAEPGRYLYQIGGVPPAFPELNSGVVLYRMKKDILDLIQQWDELYRNEIALKISKGIRPWHDQLAFTRAIYGSNVSFLMLPPEFNARVLMPQMVSGPIRIAHCRLKRPERYEVDLRKLNQDLSPRNINPYPKRVLGIIRRTMLLFQILKR